MAARIREQYEQEMEQEAEEGVRNVKEDFEAEKRKKGKQNLEDEVVTKGKNKKQV